MRHPPTEVDIVKAAAAVVAAPIALTLLIGAGFSAQDDDAPAASGVNEDALPALARTELPELQDLVTRTCPQLPLLWIVAEAQAESAWNAYAFSAAGAAGLLQLMPDTWIEAGGPGPSWMAPTRPPADHPVWDPQTHVRIAVGWMCANLRLVTDHLRRTGKPTEALDALAVCHIAGCDRVTRSKTGIPGQGEAGCSARCAKRVTAYIATIHRWVTAFAAPIATSGGGSAPQPYTGRATGCRLPDPTGTGGCVTGATAWLLAQVQMHVHQGPVSCWDAHAWNPTSDHPQGKACDYTIGRAGTFPGQADIARGWTLAQWLRTYAGPLHIAYVIWQGRIWSAARNAEGWRVYGGGGVYDPTDPTGGHHDHIHASLAD